MGSTPVSLRGGVPADDGFSHSGPIPVGALIALAIAFGARGSSHVHDSGFRVVTRSLGLPVSDGPRTWTVLTTVLGVAGFLLVSLLWLVPT